MYDVIIIGAGPAGLMTAIQASKNGNKVLVIEKNSTPGKKLLITGNGRCNVTNLKSNQVFLDTIGYNKKYLYSAINKFGPYDIYNFFVDKGVLLKEEKDNQIFPVSEKSNDILNALLNDCSLVEFNYGEVVLEIVPDEFYSIVTDKDKYSCRNIVIATGGASYKETGSTGDHLGFANMLGQPFVDLFPCETSIILSEKLDLAGTTVENIVVKYLKYETSGNLMFTHKGLSGSAIMKMSEHIYLNEEKNILIDLLPDYSSSELLDIINSFDSDKFVFHFLCSFFSKRFSDYIVGKLNLDKVIKSVNKKVIDELITYLKGMPFIVKGVEELEKAFVTGGGINMNYIDTTTMESKISKGLYFAGEALDIHGPIGGYNITLALSTGYLAGISIKKDI